MSEKSWNAETAEKLIIVFKLYSIAVPGEKRMKLDEVDFREKQMTEPHVIKVCVEGGFQKCSPSQ